MNGSFKTALIAAVVSAFVAAGAAVATTQTFMLGTTNTVDAASTVTAGSTGLNAKMLQLANNSTGSSASALGLTTASTRPPMIVNSQAKVANLNADKLDGLDSTAFQRRVSGACTSGSAIRSITSSGSVTCQDVQPKLLLEDSRSSTDVTDTFTTSGGPLLVLFSGSLYRETPGEMGLQVGIGYPNGSISFSYSKVYTNEANSHKATVPLRFFDTFPAGTYTFSVHPWQGIFDDSDSWNVLIVEFPH